MDDPLPTTYWHGGPPGRKRGEFLLPPAVTKARSLSEFGAAGVHRVDRVYVATMLDGALFYAAGWPRGVIYECEPIGTLEPDPDCSMAGLSWQCEMARIVRVIRVPERVLARTRAALFGK